MFEIGGNVKIGMSVFTTVLPTKKPTAKKVHSESNKPLQTTSKLVCEETGVALYRNQIGTYYPLGGEKVRLDQAEMKKIKNFGTNAFQFGWGNYDMYHVETMRRIVVRTNGD